MTPQGISDLVQSYADGPRLLDAAVAGLSNEELRFKPGPEHWSILENVFHLADADLVAAVRLRFVLAQPGATLVGFDQNLWAKTLHLSSRSSRGALALFRAVRESTAELLRSAPAEAWEHTGLHNESGPQTLEWIVRHFTEHLPGHLNTIAKRRRQYKEARG